MATPTVTPTLADAIPAFLDYLVVVRNLSRRTRQAYGCALRQLAAFLDARAPHPPRLDAVTEDDVIAWLMAMAEKTLPQTRAQYLFATRAFFRFCVKRHLLVVNPIAELEAPRHREQLPRVLTEAEIAKLLDAPYPYHAIGFRDRAAFELLYGAGLRVAELCGLNVDDVDLTARTVRVRKGKGGKERIVPMGTKATQAVADYLPWRRARGGTTALILSRTGGRVPDCAIRRALRLRAKAVGISGRVSPHTLRHSMATHMLRHGADIRVIQVQLGHEGIQTTQRYTRVVPTHLSDVFAATHPRA